jgi:DNA-binding Lrp family transcriptional regulator
MPLDPLDLKIVAAVQRDARITNQALSERVGLSPSPCLQRFRRLERDGVIGPYHARIDLDRICPNVMVLTTATLEETGPDAYRAFESHVGAIPEVIQCFKVSGAFDYLLWFVCATVADYHRISEARLVDGPGAPRLSSHVVLDRTKAFDGLPLEALLARAATR